MCVELCSCIQHTGIESNDRLRAVEDIVIARYEK